MFRTDLENGWWPASRSIMGLVILLTASLAVFVPASRAQVDVTVEITGIPDFGASLTAKANIDIQDGSTFQSISWTQTGGAAASISPTDANPTTVTLGAESVFKDELIAVLLEPPIGPDQLPPNVPVPEDEFTGGLQNRFQVVAVNPFALEEAGKVTIKAEVTTTSGVYEVEAEIHTMLPWRVKADIGNHVRGYKRNNRKPPEDHDGRGW